MNASQIGQKWPAALIEAILVEIAIKSSRAARRLYQLMWDLIGIPQ
jgi:hypothetical protein